MAVKKIRRKRRRGWPRDFKAPKGYRVNNQDVVDKAFRATDRFMRRIRARNNGAFPYGFLKLIKRRIEVETSPIEKKKKKTRRKQYRRVWH